MDELAARVLGAALAALWAPGSLLASQSEGPATSDLLAAACAWCALIAAALWLLGALVLRFGGLCGRAAPLRSVGKPLAALELRDEAFIAVNKLATAIFSFHLVRYCCLGSVAAAAPLAPLAPAPLRWSRGLVDAADVAQLLDALARAAPALAPAAATAAATTTAPALLAWLLSALYGAASVLLLFFVYDCAYAPFHLALHHGSVYALVHKHHHRSAAPHRGNADAINVHPLEFALGEYNHLLALHAVARLLAALGMPPLHVACVAVFVLGGGVLASLNHTRFDIRGPFGLFSVAWHDIHHHAFAHNYGQYTMAVDALMGTFRGVEDPRLAKEA